MFHVKQRANAAVHNAAHPWSSMVRRLTATLLCSAPLRSQLLYSAAPHCPARTAWDCSGLLGTAQKPQYASLAAGRNP